MGSGNNKIISVTLNNGKAARLRMIQELKVPARV